MKTELTITLDFACCSCKHPVQATVRCSGQALEQTLGNRGATIKVPCPDCGQVNELYFDSTGRIRSVRLYPCFHLIPEPSIN